MTVGSLKNFVNKRHAEYAGWILGELCDAGLAALPVKLDGEYSALIKVLTEDSEFMVVVPPPPEGWDIPRME